MQRLMLGFMMVCLAAGAKAADKPSPPPGTFCWPMHFAGIVPGITVDAQVVRLLGPGILKPGNGDRNRYYVDPRGTATLCVEMFTDKIVGRVTVKLGVRPDLSVPERRQAVSRFFSPREGFGNWHALSLGSTRKEVADNLGPPAEGEGEETWVYHARRTCEIPEFLTVHFRAGKLVRVEFYAPPG